MQKKKPYTKPEIGKILMTPDDAVLTACKTSGRGPGGGRRRACDRRGRRCQTRQQGS